MLINYNHSLQIKVPLKRGELAHVGVKYVPHHWVRVEDHCNVCVKIWIKWLN